jgi:hypothetical protein
VEQVEEARFRKEVKFPLSFLLSVFDMEHCKYCHPGNCTPGLQLEKIIAVSNKFQVVH